MCELLYSMQNILNGLVKIIVYPITINLFYPYRVINKNQVTGTGIIIEKNDNSLYILTCAHVVEDKAKISVVSSHSKEHIMADVIGLCIDKDVAILKIIITDANKEYVSQLKAINIDNEISILQGDIVKAVGFPLADDNIILTSGVVSGTNKNRVQFDAPVNPGNSGGPLINSNFQIIAVVSAKIPNNIASNVAYGTPINQINYIQNDLMKDNAECNIIYEPKLGMTFMTCDKNVYEFLGMNMNYGYFIKKIFASSPFYRLINENSIILEIDDKKIDRFGDIPFQNFWTSKLHITDYVARKKAGDILSVKILGIKDPIIVRLDNKDIYNVKMIYYPFSKIDYEIFGGMVMTQLTINQIMESTKSVSRYNDYLLTKYLQTDFRDCQIIFVSAILQGSLVSESETFSSGEIIEYINDQPIQSMSETMSPLDNARYLIKNTSGKYVKFTSQTGRFIVVDIEKAVANENELANSHRYEITNLNREMIAKLKGAPEVVQANPKAMDQFTKLGNKQHKPKYRLIGPFGLVH